VISVNLLIENLNSNLLNSIDVNIIKTLNGEFTKSDLERELVNLYFNKVIIDITAIKGYVDYSFLFDFLSYFDKNKVIILLNDSELVNSNNYLSKLVKEGYYNFTRNAAGINYLIENPNELKDVEKYIVPDTFQNPLFANAVINNNGFVEQNNNTDSDDDIFEKDSKQIIIGIQNLTSHAGSTTLMYMLVKQLRYNYNVQGIEMMSQDYIYFRDPDIMSITSLEDLKVRLKTFNTKEVVIVDLNDVDGTSVCDQILYLIEPGITKLSKLIKSNRDLYLLMKTGKIVLNRSTLKDEDIANFEYETKLKVFYNMPNFNERKDRIQIVDALLIKLGFKKQSTNRGMFGIFK